MRALVISKYRWYFLFALCFGFVSPQGFCYPAHDVTPSRASGQLESYFLFPPFSIERATGAAIEYGAASGLAVEATSPDLYFNSVVASPVSPGMFDPAACVSGLEMSVVTDSSDAVSTNLFASVDRVSAKYLSATNILSASTAVTQKSLGYSVSSWMGGADQTGWVFKNLGGSKLLLQKTTEIDLRRFLGFELVGSPDFTPVALNIKLRSHSRAFWSQVVHFDLSTLSNLRFGELDGFYQSWSGDIAGGDVYISDIYVHGRTQILMGRDLPSVLPNLTVLEFRDEVNNVSIVTRHEGFIDSRSQSVIFLLPAMIHSGDNRVVDFRVFGGHEKQACQSLKISASMALLDPAEVKRLGLRSFRSGRPSSEPHREGAEPSKNFLGGLGAAAKLEIVLLCAAILVAVGLALWRAWRPLFLFCGLGFLSAEILTSLNYVYLPALSIGPLFIILFLGQEPMVRLWYASFLQIVSPSTCDREPELTERYIALGSLFLMAAGLCASVLGESVASLVSQFALYGYLCALSCAVCQLNQSRGANG